MAIVSKVLQVATAATKVSCFSTTTPLSWFHAGPHTCNTGVIFFGDGVVTNQTVIRTGDPGLVFNPSAHNAFVEGTNLYVNSAAVSNQLVLLYIERS